MKVSRYACLVLWFFASIGSFASAYDAHPKLIVVIVIDQFRTDYLERYRDQFGDGGFRIFLDRGAYFTDCNYDYANTRTAPGHAALFTGTYTSGNGILSNEWWDPQKKKRVTSVEDDSTHLVGMQSTAPGASPHNLLSDTFGDELKLATGGKSRVFAISLKDRAAVLPAGFAGDAAFWIDSKTGAWLTSTYYRQDLPEWARDFNSSHRPDKYWNREWKDDEGKDLASTAHRNAKDGSPASFYEVVGATPFANDYEFEFAKELVLYEKLGAGKTTDLLSISLSANDIVGHQVGPDSPVMRAMTLATDRQLADFFNFLAHQIGLANVWIALSADHGISPLPEDAKSLRLPGTYLDPHTMRDQINAQLAKKYSRKADYLLELDYPMAWLNEEAFTSAGKNEAQAESDTGEAMEQSGFLGFFTKFQLAHGEIPPTEAGHRYAHSYSPVGGWYVLGVPTPFRVAGSHGTDHATPFSYDTHVPLLLYGLGFQPGVYRTHSEPIDLAVTLASLLGINPPAQATGRVLTEALPPSRKAAPATGGKP
jgi:predicted AlkP superfamily pyrophosphatase or phosphodiesterase